MFRHGEFSTEIDRKPFVFTLLAFSVSLTAALLLFIFGAGDGLAIFAGILLSVVAIAAAAVLFAMVTDRAYIADEKLYMRYLFRRSEVALGEIGRITLKEDVYSVFDKRGKLAGTINAKLTGIDRILFKLDKSGASFV
ncbi:MAG: hypothetical protein IKD61_05445 [Oscillospiraceae bacterium]|nr:hypothetical protein [Oscillospiraceae bacterium]